MEQQGRDPYQAFLKEFRADGAEQRLPYYAIGVVEATLPGLRIKTGELTLEGDDLRVARSLLVPEGEPAVQSGLVVVVDKVTYPVSSSCTIEFRDATLKRGDEVLMIPSADGQLYYVIDKVVGL